MRDPFESGGEMAVRMREFPWGDTSLGPVEGWPATLRVCVELVLAAREPLWLTWGERERVFYNDACATRLFGDRHPDALGRPAAEVWGDLWPTIDAGSGNDEGPAWKRAMRLEVRHGFDRISERLVSFSSIPLSGEDGRTGRLWLAIDHGHPEQVLASMAHELRTPINAILAWSQLLAADVGSGERQRGLDAIERSARTQVRLLDDMMLVARGREATVRAADAFGRPGEPSPAGRPAVDLRGLSVLVVDDDDDARDTTSRVLVGGGAEVRTAASGAEALDALARFQPDLIVSDVTMPGLDGYQFLQRVRASGDGHARIPAIAVTSLTASEDRQQAYRAGFQLHVAKPVESGELLLAVANLTGRLEGERG